MKYLRVESFVYFMTWCFKSFAYRKVRNEAEIWSGLKATHSTNRQVLVLIYSYITRGLPMGLRDNVIKIGDIGNLTNRKRICAKITLGR